MSPEPLVSIVGAGPAGLTLARYLQKHGIPVQVFEAEASASARSQGGTLDLHADTGLRALLETGLIDKATALMRTGDAEAMRIVDKEGKVWREETSKRDMAAFVKGPLKEPTRPTSAFSGRPEIDRIDLRNLLLDSLEPDTVKWGHAVASASAPTNDSYTLQFKNGTSATTPILIGADGTWSKVRPLLHAQKPEYSGLMMVDMEVPAAASTPELRAVTGPGAVMILSDEQGIFGQNNSGGKTKVYAAFVVPEDWAEQNPLPEGDGPRRAWISKHYDGWAGAAELLAHVETENMVPRKIYQFATDLTWTSELSGVTVIGDAAHVMSPFAGEGVNQAMADAADLGATLVDVLRPTVPASLPPFPLSLVPAFALLNPAPTTPLQAAQIGSRAELGAALRAFEAKMMARARPEMIGSKENLGVAFGPNGAQAFAHLMFMFPFLFVRDLALAPLYWLIGKRQ
ncbi:Tetracycline resistance protein from transposon [Vanrija pseudolonga]|uniref:Tetracycline resistance protein from transposon n=1 Tax=Vanrija pseudolonga TaxID=143232 RepID=A0AAF0YCN4_9TREE|nr:Tetracycline resistance protein from transposon [Vanrija pseudolonga]